MPSVTNVEKLSLTPSIPLATQVAVSDGFYVSGLGALDGFYAKLGTVGGKDAYSLVGSIGYQQVDFGVSSVTYNVGVWTILDANGSGQDSTDSNEDHDQPWDDHTWAIATLTHPALQQLAAPGGGALLVSGSSQNGLYYRVSNIQWNLPGGMGEKILKSGSEHTFLIEAPDHVLVYYSNQDVATPDLVTVWFDASDDTEAAITVALTDPQAAVFVSGGTQDGVNPISTTSPTVGGKAYYQFLGNSNKDVAWNAVDKWEIRNNDDAGAIYYSLSDVATPDLASNWKNASDDSPASISVTSVTQGQLGAGLRIGSDTFVVNGNENGRNKYYDVVDVAISIYWDADHGRWQSPAANINLGNVAFPFLGTPEVTVDRDDVANEANWIPGEEEPPDDPPMEPCLTESRGFGESNGFSEANGFRPEFGFRPENGF